MSDLKQLRIGAIAPEIEIPNPASVIWGEPVFALWIYETHADMECGVWQTTPGKWRVRYRDWSYCCIMDGCCVITDDAGQSTHFVKGDSFVLRPGFSGTWEVPEDTRVDFVIRRSQPSPASAA